MIQLSLHTTLQGANGRMEFSVEGEIKKGQFLCLSGTSGVGKTTLLRMLAGLIQPNEGRIFFAGECWLDTEKKIFLPPQKRRVGLVFQDYALFPHMTVRQNLLFPMGKQKDDELVNELIHMMELVALQDQKPARLSGGQQQRVALARALAFRPGLLLLDEPLSALDRQLRIQLQHYLQEVHERFQLTTILVSHDEQEITSLADFVWVMEEGKVSQRGKAEEIFSSQQKVTLVGTVKEVVPHDYFQEVILVSGPNEWKVRMDLKHAIQRGQKLEVQGGFSRD